MSMPRVPYEELSPQARFVSDLSDLVGQRLLDWGVFYPAKDAVGVIVKWTARTARASGCRSLEEFIVLARDDMDGHADAVFAEMLLGIAEERPGSDPWAHEDRIPLPASIAGMVAHTLVLCATVAFANDADSWALHATTLSSGYTGKLSELLATAGAADDEDTMTVRGQGGMVEIRGPFTVVPQPAAAYTARFLEACADRLEQGRWVTSRDGDTPAREAEVAANLRLEAVMLRDLTARFGTPTAPVERA